jgi:hypothetical protein
MIITVRVIALLMNWCNNRLLPLIRQFFLIPNRINEFFACLRTTNMDIDTLGTEFNSAEEAGQAAPNSVGICN